MPTNEKVNFLTATEDAYSRLTTKDSGTFYRITGNGGNHLYLGNTQLDNAVATNDKLGSIMTGYTNTSDNYALQVDSQGKAYVNVPSYKAGTGLTLNGDGNHTFNVNLLDNLTTNTAGQGALDAKQGKALKDLYDQLNTNYNTLNNNFNNLLIINNSSEYIITAIKAVKEGWDTFPIGINMQTIIVNGPQAGIITYKLNTEGTHGCVLMFHYFISKPIYMVISSGNWLPACYLAGKIV